MTTYKNLEFNYLFYILTVLQLRTYVSIQVQQGRSELSLRVKVYKCYILMVRAGDYLSVQISLCYDPSALHLIENSRYGMRKRSIGGGSLHDKMPANLTSQIC